MRSQANDKVKATRKRLKIEFTEGKTSMNTTNALLALLLTTTGANTILSANTSTTEDNTPPPPEQTQSLQDIQLQKAHTYIHTHCRGFVYAMNNQHDAPSHLLSRNVAKVLFPNDRDARQHYTIHNNNTCSTLREALPHLFLK